MKTANALNNERSSESYGGSIVRDAAMTNLSPTDQAKLQDLELMMTAAACGAQAAAWVCVNVIC
ncbi:hypothetical protein [Paraburkholderia megapolitana]|uniref:hypothetical protein n=1 Tax=Paraburkholderia megapolitana TaxID=420953 RepID=UPI0038BA60DE